MIRPAYYSAYKENTTHRAIGSKEEVEWIKRQDEHMAAARERVKLAKTRQKSLANKRRKVVQESGSESENEEDKADDT